jgi:hypothetical protein
MQAIPGAGVMRIPIKLIEHDGVIHKLVQRLMEKHPNNDSVSLPTRPLRRRNPKLTNSQLRLGFLMQAIPGAGVMRIPSRN